MPTGNLATLFLGCPSGTPISGGASWGGFVAGVTIQADRPDPESGTPDTWLIQVANTSANTIQLSADVVCVTAGGSRPVTNHQARVVKKTLTKLADAAKG